jgi:heterodisulfide reductase subunit C
MAMEEGIPAKEKNIHLFHEAFIQSVRRGGRAHEVTMLMDYMLRSRDLMKDSLIPGVKLFLKGKFPLVPSFIKGRGEIKRIFERCKK